MPLNVNANSWVPKSLQVSAPSSQPISISRSASKSTFQPLTQQQPAAAPGNCDLAAPGHEDSVLDAVALLLHDDHGGDEFFDAEDEEASEASVGFGRRTNNHKFRQL